MRERLFAKRYHEFMLGGVLRMGKQRGVAESGPTHPVFGINNGFFQGR